MDVIKPNNNKCEGEMKVKRAILIKLIALVAAVAGILTLLNGALTMLRAHVGLNYSDTSPTLVLEQITGNPAPKGIKELIVHGHDFGGPNQAWVYVEGSNKCLRTILHNADRIDKDEFLLEVPTVPSGAGVPGMFHADAVSAKWFDSTKVKSAAYFRLTGDMPNSHFIYAFAVEDLALHRLYISAQG